MFIKLSHLDTSNGKSKIINTDKIALIEDFGMQTLITLDTNDEIEVNLPLYNFTERYMKDLIKQPRD